MTFGTRLAAARFRSRRGREELIEAPLRLCCYLSLVLGLLACNPAETPWRAATPWLVVNYWATWCSPCREEIPELNQLALYKPAEITVAGVNYDSPDASTAQQQEAEMGITFNTLSDSEAAALGLKKPQVLPTTYLLYKGELRKEMQGPQTLDSILAAIQAEDAAR